MGQGFLTKIGIIQDSLSEEQEQLCELVDEHRKARDKDDAETCKQIRKQLREMSHKELNELLQENVYQSDMVKIANM